MTNTDLQIDLELQGQPFVLVSRNPASDTANLRTTTAVKFTNVAKAANWVQKAEEAGRNLYVIRNCPKDGHLYRRNRDGLRCRVSGWGNPPLVEDIELLEWLVIDIDPANSAYEAARTHANWLLDQLQVPLNYRLFSGRGVQAGIRFASAVGRAQTDKFQSAITLADRVNAWLKSHADPSLVSIDDVSNINRMSRLCGTINQKTGERVAWIDAPNPNAVVHEPDGLLSGIVGGRVRHWQVFGMPEGLPPYVIEIVKEVGRQPNEIERNLLEQISNHTIEGQKLNAEFLHRAKSGEDWAGNINPDRSARMFAFAMSALRAGQPVVCIVQALLDPSNAVLNEHWLHPKSGRPKPERVAYRAVAKAIMSISIEFAEVEYDYAS